MKKIYKYQITIFIVVFLFSVVANITNINIVLNMYGDDGSILFGSTLDSPDNAWYLSQIKNYLNGMGFTIDPLDPIYAVRRTPGYPLFYGVHYYLFGESVAHNIIPYTQTILHSLAAVVLFKIAFALFEKISISLIAGLLYGFSPFVVSFLFMTITEAIFPALIIFSLYFSILSFKRNSLFYSFYGGLIMALVVMVSPRTGLTIIFIVPLILFYKNLDILKKYKLVLIYSFTFLIAMSPWTIRNYLLINKFIPLETYYLNHTMGDENLKLIALTNWWATWGSPAKDNLHAEFVKDLFNNDQYNSIDNFIDNHIPSWVYTVENKNYTKNLFIKYHNCMLRSIELNGGRRLRYLEKPDLCEYEVSELFEDFTEKIKTAYPLEVYVISPFFRRGLQYIFHSGIHVWRSFDDYKDVPLKLILKGFAYSINVFIWFCSIAYLLSPRSLSEKLLLGSIPVISFIFIVYFRHVEGRYLLGIYPFLYLMTSIFINDRLLPFVKRILIMLPSNSRVKKI